MSGRLASCCDCLIASFLVALALAELLETSRGIASCLCSLTVVYGVLVH